MGKRGSQDPRVVLHNIYVQLLPLNFISCHKLVYLIKSQIFIHDWPEIGRKRCS